MTGIYISVSEINESTARCDIDSAIVFFIYEYLKYNNPSCPTLNLVVDERQNGNVKIDVSNFLYHIKSENNLDDIVKICFLPVCYFKENNYCIAGFCGVLRQLVKIFEVDRWLLGFRDACLSACAESSIWTKFCEVDLITTIKQCLKVDNYAIPEDIIRLEYHLRQPVRTHNIRKKNESFPSMRHCYVEGPEMFLPDLIIFPLVHAFFALFPKQHVSSFLPLVCEWYTLMLSDVRVANSLSIISIPSFSNTVTEFVVPIVPVESLYKCDPRRYKASEKIFTKQEEVEHVTGLIDAMGILHEYDYWNTGEELFDWDNIPFHAHPKGGDLPDDRLLRKMQQIESIVKPTLKISEYGDTIVDFCCGAGHVGILIAYLLPKCHILLLDNKEHSLRKAFDRVERLNLKNVSLIQSNIDYFKGNFQLGVTLHACGVAADLVMKACISNRSKFVISPCCYGKLKVNHILKYPRSERYSSSSLTVRDYIVAGHSADQTHKDEYSKSDQGEKCMKIVDLDRCLHAEECDYRVYIAKMKPITCSPKNNFIVGVPEELFKYQHFS